MKKMKLVVAMFVVAGMTLVGCGSDDSGPAAPAEITVKWNQTKTVTQVANSAPVEVLYEDNVADCTKNYVEFATPNVYKDVVYFKQSGQCQANSATPGTWTKSDDNLTIVNGGDLTGTYKITKLTSTELNIMSENTSAGVTTKTTVYFTKAAE